MPELITSPSNPRVKQLVKWRNAADRKEDGVILIEGVREFQRAVGAGIKIREIYVCPELMAEEDRKNISKDLKTGTGSVFQLSDKVYAKVSYGEREEGLIAVAEPKLRVWADLPARKDLLLVVVEKVEKPGNLGAILRTCDAVGVDGVIVCDQKTDIFNPNVIRSSIGTIFTVKVVTASNEEAMEFLKSRGVRIFAASPSAQLIYTKADFHASSAIVVGSEQSGLSKFWLKQADQLIQIPMLGQADSLNVSASTAILLYEALRQRK